MFPLHSEWLEFTMDFVANLTKPGLSQGGAWFSSNTPLSEVHNYHLETALLALVRQHGSITFHNGLPMLPHDWGYSLWSVTITPEKVVCTPHFQNKVRKMSKKIKRFKNFSTSGDAFENLRRFGLPITLNTGDDNA